MVLKQLVSADGFFKSAIGLIIDVDFVILITALHTVLTNFRPRTVMEESGLYPYGYALYTGYVIYPSLLSSLAFTNSKEAYVVHGVFFALPTRSFWYPLAIS